MFCSNCGKEIPDTSKVCGYCGHKIPTIVHQPQSVPQTESKPALPPSAAAKPTSKPPEERNKRERKPKPPKERSQRQPIPLTRWVTWLVGGLIAVGINYLGGYLYSKGILYLMLNSIGTAGFAVYAGPIGGIVVGAIFQLLATLTYSNVGYYFISGQVVIALVAWGVKRLG
jgi:hypothetical protein